MRENRLSGSEGGGNSIVSPYPYLHRHARSECPVRQVGEHRIGKLAHDGDPRVAIASGGGRDLIRSRDAWPRRRDAGRTRRFQKFAAIHLFTLVRL